MNEKQIPLFIHLKRTFDFIISILVITVLLPILLIVAVLVLAFLGRPIIFRHKRPGLYGVPFELLKFRSMRLLPPGVSEINEPENRITPFGRFLRSTSLDELPSLWNVVRGDMSLVGPRPLLMGYLDLYTDEQNRRHDVKPGITGWAQVNGRNSITWPEKFELDIWYVDNCSLSLDLRILLLTAKKVLVREHISPNGADEMEPYRGGSKK